MKKNFLKIIFAMTMGVSLFSWKSIGANVNAKTIDDTNISMETNETHTFEGASSIELISGNSVIIDGTTIKAKNVGESIVNVDGTLYTIKYSLPAGYAKLTYATFNKGAAFDTGYVLVNDSVHISFNYDGSFSGWAFGAEEGPNGIEARHFSIGNGKVFMGPYSTFTIGEGLSSIKKDKTLFDLTRNGTNVNLHIGNESFAATNFNGNFVSGLSLYFGQTNRSPSLNSGYFKGKLYDLLIENAGVIVRSYIPCEDKASLKIGLYDVINNVFVSSRTNVPISYENNYIDDTVSYRSNANCPIIQPKNQVLFLDSNADFKNMDGHLFFEDGATLINEITGDSLVFGEDSLNLENLFGEMQAGIKYTIKVVGESMHGYLDICKTTGISTLYVTTEYGYDYLIQNKSFTSTGSIVLDDGEMQISESISKIKGRGNSFSSTEKSSFNLNLKNSQQLIPGAESQKKYALLGLKPILGTPTTDTSYLSTQSAFSLYEELTLESDAIQYTMVNLIFDNNFLGLYMLSERVRIDESVVNITEYDMEEGSGSRTVNSSAVGITPQEQTVLNSGIVEFKYCPSTVVNSSGGFILEAGYYYDSAQSGFITSHGNRWEVKEPEALSLSQISNLAIHMQKVEDALFSDTGFNSEGKHYSELLDLDSLAREFLIRAFTLEHDFYNTSNYLYIDGDNNGVKGKMKAGPVWDFDNNYVHSNTNSLFHRWGDGTNRSATLFLDKLLEKGDFFAILEDINSSEFESIVDDFVDPNNTSGDCLLAFYNNYQKALQINDYIWNYSSVSTSLAKKNGFINRTSVWKNLWSGDYLEGVIVSMSNSDVNTMKAEAKGASGYQWYKINEVTGIGETISGATSSTYSTDSSGKYYVIVSGNNMPSVQTNTMTSNVFEKGSVDVTFEMNGHGTQIPTTKANIGLTISEPERPYEQGYLFKGWFKEASCTNPWDFENDLVQGDTVLYAKWEQGGTYFDGDVSISLKDNTWINFYTSIPEGEIEDYSFKYTLRGGTLIDIDDHLINKVNDRIRISVALLPYQLADDVVIYMYDNLNRVLCNSITLSVRSYVAYALAHSTDDNYKNALKALLNYGAAVQVWQGYHTDDLANSILNQQPGN